MFFDLFIFFLFVINFPYIISLFSVRLTNHVLFLPSICVDGINLSLILSTFSVSLSSKKLSLIRSDLLSVVTDCFIGFHQIGIFPLNVLCNSFQFLNKFIFPYTVVPLYSHTPRDQKKMV